jgi:hypothetical protein
MPFEQTLKYVSDLRKNDDTIRLKRIERYTWITNIKLHSIRLEAMAIGLYGLTIAFYVTASPDFFYNISKGDYSQFVNFTIYTVLSWITAIGGTSLIIYSAYIERKIMKEITDDYNKKD